MANQKFEFKDDELYVYTPLPQYGDDAYESRLVMNKEIFKECFKRWIIEPPNKSEKLTKLVIEIPEEIRLSLIYDIQLSSEQKSIADAYIRQSIINGVPLKDE